LATTGRCGGEARTYTYKNDKKIQGKIIFFETKIIIVPTKIEGKIIIFIF
jgi:hypothetical protein